MILLGLSELARPIHLRSSVPEGGVSHSGVHIPRQVGNIAFYVECRCVNLFLACKGWAYEARIYRRRISHLTFKLTEMQASGKHISNPFLRRCSKTH